jgi:hypothetical protein
MEAKIAPLNRSAIHAYVDGDQNQVAGYIFFCPGCNEHHSFSTVQWIRRRWNSETRKYEDEGPGPVWSFNGNMDKPTFSPSLVYPDKKPRCHLFLTDGRIQYLSDCGHALAGQTVDLPFLPK